MMLWNDGGLVNYRFDEIPEPTTILQGDIYAAMQRTGPGYYPMVTGELLQVEGTLVQQLAAGDITPEDAMAELQEVYMLSVEAQAESQ